MFHHKILSSKTIHKAKLFSIKKLEVEVKPGVIHTHEVVQRNDTISVFPVTADNEVYLVSQYRYNFDKVTLEAMSGFVDPGETPLAAAKRELKEETGIVAREWKNFNNYHLAASVISTTNHLFLAWDLAQGIAQPMEDEEIEVVKLPLHQAIEKIMTGHINHSSTMIGLLMLEKILNKDTMEGFLIYSSHD